MRILLIFLVFNSSIARAMADPNFVVDLKGVNSQYTRMIKSIAESWSRGQGDFCNSKDPVGFPKNIGEIRVTPHLTQSDAMYMGFSAKMKYNGTPANFVKALTDIKGLKTVHFDYDEVAGTWAEDGRFELTRVKYVSFFKVKTTHTLKYQIFQIPNKMAIVVWKLKEPEDIIASDGVFLISKVSDEISNFCQISFYDAKWGPAWFVKNRIWKESFLGVIREAMSFRIRSNFFGLNAKAHQNKVEARLPKGLDFKEHILPLARPVPVTPALTAKK